MAKLTPKIIYISGKDFKDYGKQYILQSELDRYSDEFKEYLEEIDEKIKKLNVEKFYFECECQRENKVQLNIRSKNILAHYPNQSNNHAAICTLNDNEKDDYQVVNENISSVSTYLFDEPQEYTNRVEWRTKSPEETKKLFTRSIKTFGGVCQSILSQAYTHAFNKINRGKDRLTSVDLQNVTQDELLECFSTELEGLKLGKSTLSKHKEVKKIDVLFGITYKDFSVSEASKNSKEIAVNLEGYNNLTANPKTIISMMFYAKIYNTIVKPPYFYLFITKNQKIVRGFIYPVVIHDKLIATVESDKERDEIQRMFKNGMVIYKPIVTSQIYSALTSTHELSKKLRSQNKNNYRPDVLQFVNNEVLIGEINGDMGSTYNISLKEKEERFYSLLQAPFKYTKI